MRTVLFLGAGFSAALDMPVMNNFFDAVRDNERLGPEEKKLVEELRREAGHANRMLNTSRTNLEDILSLALMGDRVGPETRSERIRRILRTVYTTVLAPGKYWQSLSALKTFLGLSLRDPFRDTTFITTNYDLNIECALHSLHQKAATGFDFVEIDSPKHGRLGSLYSPSGVPVYKLHGSVNWHEYPTAPDTFTVENRIVRVGRTEMSQLPLCCAHSYECPSPPQLVPPTFLKTDLKRPLQQVWRGATEALRAADELVFVGYSFPASDTEMRFFLASGLADNVGLRSIRVVDPRANDIVQRLRNPDGPFGSHFREMLISMPGEWQRQSLRILTD